MRKTLLLAAVSGSIIISCKSGDSSVEHTSFDSSIVTYSKPAIISPEKTDSTAVLNTIQTLPANATTTATSVGMNPPHGQPGHRCDIAVGAPLNSAPTQPVVTNTQPNTTQPVVISNPAPVKTAPGMNPPHGEPNHRCDIAVGAPLNSPVKAPVIKTDSMKLNATIPKDTATR